MDLSRNADSMPISRAINQTLDLKYIGISVLTYHIAGSLTQREVLTCFEKNGLGDRRTICKTIR